MHVRRDRPLIIYGAGGHAREVAWLARQIMESQAADLQACFADDAELGVTLLDDLRVASLAEAARQYPGAYYVVGVGSPSTREAMARRADEAGLEPAVLVHPRVERSRRVEIGPGSIVCAGCILTTNIWIGRHVHINLGCTIAHDARLDDFATLAPGVHVSGFVHIGKRAYLGTGAVLINGNSAKPLVIGDDAVIGAGACVIGDVPPSGKVGGVPARPLTPSAKG